MTRISVFHEEWMTDEEYRREYEALEQEFAAAKAAANAGSSGHPLAASQPSIARLRVRPQ